MKKIGVIGIGNPLRRDDGIGIILLEKLIEQKKFLPKEIKFIDGGTGGMNLLHVIVSFDIVFIIDAVELNSDPGSYRLFTADEIKINKNSLFISTHENQLPQVIEMSKQLGELPKQIFIFGIQPKDTSYGKNLSNDLQTKIDSLLVSLINEIKNVLKIN
jgi:hydrogenase maturation protease